MLMVGVAGMSCPAAQPSAGFFYDSFELTLESGRRTEVLGPLFSRQESDSITQTRWTPLFSITRDPLSDACEVDFIYPLLTYDRFGAEYRFQIFQWLGWSGGDSVTGSERRRFTLFPLYFQQRSTNPEENYTALIPLHGRLVNRLFRDEIRFTLMPLYVQSRKKDVVTWNVPYPFFHWRRGNGLEGWQFWPVIGHEHKEVTTHTDDFGDEQTVPGHDKWMAVWPFFMHNTTGIGSTNLVRERALLPLYSVTRSPARDSTSVLWPFFIRTQDHEKGYTEWDLPYPLVVFARGPGKTGSRVWPFYSRMTNSTHESRFVAWPIYKHNKVNAPPLLRERTRWMFFLYSNQRDENTTTGKAAERSDFWPLFTHRKTADGGARLQVLAPIEPFLPASKSMDRNYSPVWSIWRSESNEKTGNASQSLLWNLYRRETSPDRSHASWLFGLIQREAGPQGTHWKLLHLPGKQGRRPGQPELAPYEGHDGRPDRQKP